MPSTWRSPDTATATCSWEETRRETSTLRSAPACGSAALGGEHGSIGIAARCETRTLGVVSAPPGPTYGAVMTSIDPAIGMSVGREQPLQVAPRPRELRADAWPGYFRWLEGERDDLNAVVEVVGDCMPDGNAAHRPLREIRYDGRLGLLQRAVRPAAG